VEKPDALAKRPGVERQDGPSRRPSAEVGIIALLAAFKTEALRVCKAIMDSQASGVAVAAGSGAVDSMVEAAVVDSTVAAEAGDKS
jgi:hypothetical protein